MLTLQQQNLITALLSGKFNTNREAGISVGYSKKAATQVVSRITNEPEFQEALECARKTQLEQGLDKAKEVGKGDSRESLRQQKLSLEVALQEAKLLALQPDTDKEDAAAVRETWSRTIKYINVEACRIHEVGADAARALVDGLADAIETRSCLGVFDSDAPDRLSGWPLDQELTHDIARRIQAEHDQAERATDTMKHPYKPRNPRQISETSAHHETE